MQWWWALCSKTVQYIYFLLYITFYNLRTWVYHILISQVTWNGLPACGILEPVNLYKMHQHVHVVIIYGLHARRNFQQLWSSLRQARINNFSIIANLVYHPHRTNNNFSIALSSARTNYFPIANLVYHPTCSCCTIAVVITILHTVCSRGSPISMIRGAHTWVESGTWNSTTHPHWIPVLFMKQSPPQQGDLSVSPHNWFGLHPPSPTFH